MAGVMVVLALTVAAALVALAVAVGGWRRSLEGRLRTSDAELRRIADASAYRDGGAVEVRREIAAFREALAGMQVREEERRAREDQTWETLHRVASVLAGGQRTGRAGENVLRDALAHLPPSMVVTDFRVNGRVVEFGLVLPDGRRLPIDSIEHGSQIDVEIAREMKAQGAFHVPTISALAQIVGHPEDVPAYAVSKGEQIMGMARDAFRRAIREGVRHACGTDAGTPHNPHGDAPKEIVQMVEWGLTPLRALQAATSNAAELLRVAGEVGTVEVGKAADLVLYRGNPVDDPSVLLAPATVWQGGVVVGGAG